MKTGRREFLSHAAMGAAGLAPFVKSLTADPLGLPIGCQVYPVRDALGKDFEGTLRQIKGMGYQRIEMCSPQGYAKGGFGPLANLKASDVRKTIQSAGLGCESCHYTLRELKENLSERIAYAQELGLKQMVLSSFAVKPDAPLSEWTRVAGEFNKIAEQIHKAGFQAGFHNHDGEFKKIDGVLIYDKLMSELDPKLVKMQFQVAVVRLGVDAGAVFDKYPNRFISLHLQDVVPSTEEEKLVAIGKGTVDWKHLFEKAKKAGVKNYFVELSRDQMQDSYNYLHKLKA